MMVDQMDLTQIFLFIILAASLVLTVKTVWKRTKPKAQRSLIIWINIVVYGAVVILVLDPQIEREGLSTVTLITDSGDLTSETVGQVYLAPGVTLLDKDNKKHNPIPLSTLGQLPLKQNGLSKINLIGNGLKTDEWAQLPEGLTVTWTPGNIMGLANLSWHKQTILGDVWSVNGQFLNPAASQTQVYKITLSDFTGSLVDEVRIRQGQTFRLKTRPKAKGTLSYQLKGYGPSGDLLAEETLRVSVSLADQSKILVLQSAPSFETRHMMDWATRFNASLLIKSQISKDRFLTQAVNQTVNPAVNNTPLADDKILTSDTLGRFDILMMDGRMFLALGEGEKETLSAAIRAGLGLMVTVDSQLIENFPDQGLLSGFILQNISQEVFSAIPRWRNSQNEMALPVLPYSLSHNSGTQLVGDGNTQGRSLNIMADHGLGKISLSLLRGRHSWSTAGQLDIYASYWANLMQNVARQNKKIIILPEANNKILRVGNKNLICVLADDLGVEVTLKNLRSGIEAKLPLRNDTLGSPRKCGAFWPKDEGWYNLSASGEGANTTAEQYFYVYGRGTFKSNDAQRGQRATQAYIGALNQQSQEGVSSPTYQSINKFWVWILFVLGITLLWIDRKWFV